jgi:hypothetical protein
LKRLPVLARHNGVANVIATLASATHFHVAHEFLGRQMVTDMQRAANPQQPIDQDDEHEGVPDLVITGAGFGAFVDVAVSHTCAPSYAHRAKNQYGIVADQRAIAKHHKYDAECSKKSLSMIPFCLESFGVLHGEAADFIDRLVMHAEVGVRAALSFHARSCLSFALQRGNAMISLKGLALLRLHVAKMPNQRVVLRY